MHMSKEVILTGIRANNDLTLGNYFGAMMPVIDMAKNKSSEYQINMFVPDLHSFTTPIDHVKLLEQTMHNLRLFTAAGLPLDNPNIYIYRQSYVPAHSELTWILDCFTGVGEMSRMTQFKDKASGLNDERTSMGLFNYPVLMAADILLYNASYVPVGDDQTQHLEFTRDIAERLNSRFGELFTLPQPAMKQHEFFGNDQGLRIKDLQDPSKKMSKSDESGKGVIFLGDKPEDAAKKILSAATDSLNNIKFDWDNQPGITNLLQILALATESSQKDVNNRWEGKKSYGELKKAVADAVTGFLQGLQARLSKVEDDTVISKLEQSEKAMNMAANATLLKVQKAVGLRA